MLAMAFLVLQHMMAASWALLALVALLLLERHTWGREIQMLSMAFLQYCLQHHLETYSDCPDAFHSDWHYAVACPGALCQLASQLHQCKAWAWACLSCSAMLHPCEPMFDGNSARVLCRNVHWLPLPHLLPG